MDFETTTPGGCYVSGGWNRVRVRSPQVERFIFQ